LSALMRPKQRESGPILARNHGSGQDQTWR
jgi:hypothetical protein